MRDANQWFRFTVALLAVWRITHLLTAEDGPWNIIAWLRRKTGSSILGNLLDCFYCLSIWTSIPFCFYAVRSVCRTETLNQPVKRKKPWDAADKIAKSPSMRAHRLPSIFNLARKPAFASSSADRSSSEVQSRVSAINFTKATSRQASIPAMSPSCSRVDSSKKQRADGPDFPPMDSRSLANAVPSPQE